MKEYNHLPVQFNERIHAFSIDYGVVFLSVLIVIFMDFSPIYKYAIVLLVWYLMNIFPSYIKRGISLGKVNSGTIILDENYQKVEMRTIYLREIFILVLALITAGFYIPISFIMLLKRNDKRSIHDLIFKTRVVYAKALISK